MLNDQLPPNFPVAAHRLHQADLLIVIGTSLTVHPFASLTTFVPDSCMRVLINLERAGDFGRRSDDVILLGKCDEIVRDLCKELGWEKKLDALWKETENSITEFDEVPAETGPKQSSSKEEKHAAPSTGKPTNTRDLDRERLEEEVERITQKIGEALDISTGEKDRLDENKHAESAGSTESKESSESTATGVAVAEEPTPEPVVLTDTNSEETTTAKDADEEDKLTDPKL